jgi:HK97 family phage portal protein
MSNQNEFFQVGEELFFSEVIETETENFRQYSPFEFFAKLLNDSRNPDVYWQAYEDGVSIGAKKAIREGWRNAMAERSADRVVVLDEGMTFTPIAITPQEAQIVEMAKFGIEDIARWFNIPLHKIKSMGNSTNNNIEQQSLDYAVDCIHPYVTNIEQEDGKKLFTKKEKEAGFYIHGNLNVLLRADIKSKGEYYSKMANSGIHSRNEIRALEDMNPGPELLNEFLTPVNTFTEKQIENNLKRIGDGNAK